MEALIRLDYDKKDCFCSWRSSKFQDTDTYRVVAIITNSHKTIFVVVNNIQFASKDEIWLSSVFACKQGLTDSEMVYVEPRCSLPSVSPVLSIAVAPETDNDWEILESNQNLLIQNFLSQCCCVWSGMRLPLWVDNICLTVVVTSLGTAAASEFAVIREMSEVTVDSPMNQQADAMSDSKSLTTPMPPNGDVLLSPPFPVPSGRRSSTASGGGRTSPKVVTVNGNRRDFLTLFVSLVDFVYFLWRGHTYTCRRQMDLLVESWTESFAVGAFPEPQVCRMNVHLSQSVAWPVVYTSLNFSGAALLRVLPNRSAARAHAKRRQDQATATDEEVGNAAEEIVVAVRPSDLCEPGHLHTNDLVSRALGAGVADCLVATPLPYAGVHLRSLLVAARRCPPEVESESAVRRLFLRWLHDNFSEAQPLVVSPRGAEVRLTTDSGPALLCRLECHFQRRGLGRTREPLFALLCHRMVSSGFVRLRAVLEDEKAAPASLQPPLRAPAPSRAGDARPDAARPLPEAVLEPGLVEASRRGLAEREFVGAVVCGPPASGKTVLIRQAVEALSADANLQAHCSWLSCREWRTKAFEKFRRESRALLCEAVWRQPSVVVLDDIDALLDAGQSVEQEDDTRAYTYAVHLCALFDRILLPPDSRSRHAGATAGQQNPAQVALVVSVESGDCLSLLNDSSLRSNGTPIFNLWLDMPPVTEETVRRALLPHCVSDPTAFDLTDFVARLGKSLAAFGVGDLKLLLEKDVYEPRDQRPMLSPAARGFQEVGGLREAKRLLTQSVVWARRFPDVFERCPLRPQRGVLLFGPSGCGKTLLGRALADEAAMELISVRGPELLSKYIGASEANVRDTFARANRLAPCVLFFDDFDSLAPRRGHDSTGVTDRVVNQLLTEMDGAESRLEGVFIVAASNRPDMIDPALLRPGRLDLHVYCPLPNAGERGEIVDLLCAGDLSLTFDSAETKVGLVEETESYTGADLRSLLLAARLASLRRQGLWNIRDLWDEGEDQNSKGSQCMRINTGIEMRSEAQLTVELCGSDVRAAYCQVNASFGRGQNGKRSSTETSFSGYRGNDQSDVSTAQQLRVTLA